MAAPFTATDETPLFRRQAACAPANEAEGLVRALERRLFAPVDNAWLVMFRVVFGVVMFVEVLRYFAHGWVDSHFAAAQFHFTYHFFEWVRPWPEPFMRVHFAVLGALALCIAAGFCYRAAAGLFFLGFTYVFLLDEVYYLNHFYLICQVSLLMVLLPAHRAWSVDCLLHPVLRTRVTPAWTLWLMRAQIGIPYFFGGIAKLNADWLQGEPMRMWLARRTDFPLIGKYFVEEWMVYGFVLGGLLLDLLIVPLLLWKPTRVPAYLAAAAFHLMNARLFHIGIFPWLMLAATLIYFPPGWSRRVLMRLGWEPRTSASKDDDAREGENAPRWRRRVVMGLLAIFVVAQVGLPLRHFAYPGNVSWTEEGHRFAWHMKLRTKSGTALFHVRDPRTGEEWTVDPASQFSPSICDDLATHPDMLLQYSHWLAEQNRLAGRGEVEVRAEAWVSLNGRKLQLLVNPSVDLAKVRRSLAPANWIEPLREPLNAGRAGRDEQQAATE